MKAYIDVEMDNTAFQNAPGRELARILRELANKLESERWGPGLARERLRDINGNTVGKISIVAGKK